MFNGTQLISLEGFASFAAAAVARRLALRVARKLARKLAMKKARQIALRKARKLALRRMRDRLLERQRQNNQVSGSRSFIRRRAKRNVKPVKFRFL